MRHEELLESDGDDDDDGEGIWSSLTKTFSPSPASASGEEAEDETLNIFCLASGEDIYSLRMIYFIEIFFAPISLERNFSIHSKLVHIML